MTNKVDPLEVYQRYQAIKLHFTSKGYDFHKYGGKTSGATLEHFNKRRDKTFFYRLSNTYRPNQLTDFLVSNFLMRDKIWIGDLFDDEAKKVFNKYLSRKQAITQFFKDDLDYLFGLVSEPIDALTIEDGQYPLVIKEIIAGRFSIESFVILADVMPINYFAALDSKLVDDVMWPDIKNRAEKIKPFMTYPKRKTKNIVKEYIQDRL